MSFCLICATNEATIAKGSTEWLIQLCPNVRQEVRGGQDQVGSIQHQPDTVHKHRMAYISDWSHYQVQDALEGQLDDEVLLDHGHPNIAGGQAREESY